MWNINPIKIIQEQKDGYFAIGPWGCDGYYDNEKLRYVRTIWKFDRLIPINSVVEITKVGEWENIPKDVKKGIELLT
jgi:hypothetical protein